MANVRLEHLSEAGQQKVLAEHPDLHTYGFEKRQAVLKKAKRAEQQAASKKTVKRISEKKQDAVVKDILIKNAAKKPAAVAAAAAEPKPARVAKAAAPSMSNTDLLRMMGKASGAGNIEHYMAMTSLAGKMLDHMDTAGEDKQTHDIRDGISKFQDSLGMFRNHHLASEDPDNPRAEVHRNLAKRFITIAAQHLSDAASKFHGRFKDFSAPEYGGEKVSLGDIGTKLANSYVARNVGKVTGEGDVPVDVSGMPMSKLLEGLGSGKLKDESASSKYKTAAAKLMDPKFRKKSLAAMDAADSKAKNEDYKFQEKQARGKSPSEKMFTTTHLEELNKVRTPEQKEFAIRGQLGKLNIRRRRIAEWGQAPGVTSELQGAPTMRSTLRRNVFNAATNEGKM